MATRECEACGKSYRPTYGGQRACGRICGVELRRRAGTLGCGRRRQPETPCATCSQCGAIIPDRGSPAWATVSRPGAPSPFCAPECTPGSGPADGCSDCGATVPRGRKRCDDCKLRAAVEAKRRKRRAERARRRGVTHEPYTLAEIASRDRRTCQLCRRRVAMTKTVPHPKAPTIDHVLPIAAGGQDIRANVQLAHFECNWRKSDGGTQQLALVG